MISGFGTDLSTFRYFSNVLGQSVWPSSSTHSSVYSSLAVLTELALPQPHLAKQFRIIALWSPTSCRCLTEDISFSYFFCGNIPVYFSQQEMH
jgi:hypothetical protein